MKRLKITEKNKRFDIVARATLDKIIAQCIAQCNERGVVHTTLETYFWGIRCTLSGSCAGRVYFVLIPTSSKNRVRVYSKIDMSDLKRGWRFDGGWKFDSWWHIA